MNARMRYPKLVPFHLTLVIYLCSLPSLVSAIYSYPHPSIYPPILSQSNINLNTTLLQPNQTTPHPNPLTSVPDLDCFNTTSHLAYSLDPEDCLKAIDLILHDPTGVMTPHAYSWHAREPGSLWIPVDWHDSRCQILLTTGVPDAVDEFRLVEVIVAAQRILDDCVPMSKTSLGGLSLVGNMKGLFVAVNGPAPDGASSGMGRMV